MDNHQNAFFDFVKKIVASRITHITSLFLSVSALVSSIYSELNIFVITFLSLTTILCFSYILWLWRISNNHDRSIRLKKSIYGVLSLIVVSLAWKIGITIINPNDLGHYLMKLGKYDLALEQFEKSIKGSSRNYQTYFDIAICYKNLGNNLMYYNSLKDLLDKKIFDKPLDNNMKQFLNREIAKLLVEFQPGFIDTNIYQEARKHLYEANSLGDKTISDLWMETFLYVIINATNKTNTLDIKKYLIDKFESSLTIESHKKEFEIEPKMLTVQYYYWYGRSLLAINAIENAEKIFRKGLNASAGSKATSSILDQFNMFLGFMEVIKGKNARKSMRISNQFWENISDQQIKCYAFLMTGMHYLKQALIHDFDGIKFQQLLTTSEAFLSSAQKINNDDPNVIFALGYLYAMQENIHKAVYMFGKGTKVDERNHFAFYTLGRFLNKLGELDQSKKYFNKAVEIDSENCEYNYWLAKSSGGEKAKEVFLDRMSIFIEVNESTAIDRGILSYQCFQYISEVTLWINEKKPEEFENIQLLEDALRVIQKAIYYTVESNNIHELENEKHKLLGELAYLYSIHHSEDPVKLMKAERFVREAIGLTKKVQGDDNLLLFYRAIYLDTLGWISVKKNIISQFQTMEERVNEYDKSLTIFKESLSVVPNKYKKDIEGEVQDHIKYTQNLKVQIVNTLSIQ